MTDSEEWRAVVGYEGAYEVSNLGRVRSLDRTVVTRLGPRSYKGMTLKQQHISGDYAKVTLWLQGRRKIHAVHVLVATAFIGPRPDGHEVCHGNGNSADNRLANLRFDTKKANADDAWRHGVHYLGRRTHCINGHEFTPENTALRTDYPTGRGRRCLTCKRLSNAARASA